MVPPRARTAETYVAGIGASGALIASAFVMVVVLVGIVTFDSWPRGGTQAGGGDGQVSLNTTAPTAETFNPTAGNLAKIFNPGSAAAAASAGARHHAASQRSPGTQGTLEGGTGNQAPVESPQPPTSGGGPTGIVGRTISGLGNTVEGTTDSVGNVLGGSSGPGVGGVVAGLGHTVNGTLHGLVGNNGAQGLPGSH